MELWSIHINAQWFCINWRWNVLIWLKRFRQKDPIEGTESFSLVSTQYELFVRDATFASRVYSWLKKGRPNCGCQTTIDIQLWMGRVWIDNLSAMSFLYDDQLDIFQFIEYRLNGNVNQPNLCCQINVNNRLKGNNYHIIAVNPNTKHHLSLTLLDHLAPHLFKLRSFRISVPVFNFDSSRS